MFTDFTRIIIKESICHKDCYIFDTHDEMGKYTLWVSLNKMVELYVSQHIVPPENIILKSNTGLETETFTDFTHTVLKYCS